MLLRSIENKGKKAGAFTDESVRINLIKDAICEKKDLGIKMMEDYYCKFGKQIDRVDVAGGKKDHYDLLIYHTDGTTNKCEEKGTKYYCSKIDSTTPPHEHSVQIYNGPASTGISESILNVGIHVMSIINARRIWFMNTVLRLV